MAIGTDQDYAACRDAGAAGVDAGVARDLHTLGPASAHPHERLDLCDRSKHEQVVKCAAEPCPVGVALPGVRLRANDPGSLVVGDQRASGVVDVDHGARIALQRVGERVRDCGKHLASLPDGVRNTNNSAVDLVRHVEGVTVRDQALQSVILEQRAPCETSASFHAKS